MAVALVSLQVAVAVALATGAGPGKVWTGGTWQESLDQAIYVGYVEQVRDGAYGLQNFYAPLTERPFWHPTYVAIGLLARVTGLSSVAALTGTLWLATAAAVFVLHAVSRALARNERDASMATLLILVSGGFGWVAVLLWPGADFPWKGHPLPDLASEAFLSPNLYMGPHVILAYALLPYVLLCLWRAATSGTTAVPGRAGWIAAFVLALIHPYALPTIGFFLAFAFALNVRTSPWRLARRYVPYGVAMLAGIVPHVWGQFANAAARDLLLENNCPITPVWVWLLAFAPWIALVAARRVLRIALRTEELWIPIWLASAFLAVALPFKWDIKMAESWHAALVWLAIPVLVILRDRLCRVRVMAVALVAILSISSVLGLANQLPYGRRELSDRLPMYVADTDMAAWRWVRENTSRDARVFPSSFFAGGWSPAFTQRSTWIGHPFATPDYESKRALFPTVLAMDPPSLSAFLDGEGIDVVLASIQYQTDQYASKLDPARWHVGAQFGPATAFVRTEPAAIPAP